jgi:Flp pilus assembly protein TadG
LGGRARDERGQAATELVIILPVFLALVFGLIELGKGFAYWVDMTHLAGESGRYASVSWFPGCPSNSTGTCSGATLKTFVAGQADTKELANGEPANANAEVPTGLQISYCYPTQGTGIVSGEPGSALQVNVTSTYRLALIRAAFNWLPEVNSLAVVHLKARSTIRLERPIDADRLGQATIGNCP